MSNPPLTPNDYFRRLMRLLTLEAKAEAAQFQAVRQQRSLAERSGSALWQLFVRDERVGLGGRVLVTLSKRTPRQPLPWNRLRVGTPVLLSAEEAADGWSKRGVVSQQQRTTIQVAIDDWLEPSVQASSFRLDLASDEIARQRQRTALEQARLAKGDRLTELRQVLLGQDAPQFEAEQPFEPFNTTLNPSQRAAVQFALAATDVAIIHGPPGTGKTTTLVELIRQAVERGARVLACAPSNTAVDNLFEKLLASGEKVIRLGHPARVSPALREQTLDMLVENHPDVKIARKLARDAYTLRDQAAKHRRAKPAPGEKRGMRQEAKSMLADARRMEAQAVERILDGATVLCVTNTGIDSRILGERQFDLCVMDEAGQTTEPGTWIPILRSNRVVFAGDHCQLPPTVISREAAKQGFNVSLMERLMRQTGGQLSRPLTRQYRMHHEIMEFSSAEFYEATLEADESVAHHLLTDLPDVTAVDLTATAVHFIDTAGASYDEEPEPDGASRLNPQEAELVGQKVTELMEIGVAAANIAVIAPYSAQVRHLRELLGHDEALEVDSVDGFQGREKEAVIISLVRSNEEGEIGFLADTRRMNVALTRARRKLIVIGDSATMTTHPFYQRLVAYFETIGAYHSVWEAM